MKIDPAWVLKLILSVAEPGAPWAETYPSSAEAIADATSEPMEAAVEVAVAKFESNFNPGALGDCAKDKNGQQIRTVATCRSFGLFQISKAHAPVMLLLLPTSAAVVCARLIRKSRSMCGSGENALSWYGTGGPRCVAALPESKHRMWMASRLLRANAVAVE